MRPNTRWNLSTAICLSVLAVSGASSSTLVAATPATRPSDTFQRASCVYRVEVDRDRSVAPGPVLQTVQAAVTSSALLDPVMKSAIGLDAGQWPRVVQIEVQPIGDVAIKVTVSSKSDGELTVPETASARVVAELTRQLLASFNADDDKAVEGKRDALAARRREVEIKIATLQAKLNVRPTRVDGSNEAAERTMLERQRDVWTSEREVQKAMLVAIEQQLADLKEEGPEIAQVKSRLVGQRVEANLAVARLDAQLAQAQKRVAAMAQPATLPAAPTAAEADPAAMSSELASLHTERSEIDQSMRELASQRRSSAGARLVAIVGGGR